MTEGNRALLRPAEVARLLGLTTGRIYQLIQAREIPAVRVGGAWRVPAAAWEQWLRRQCDNALALTVRTRDGSRANT